MTTIYRYIGKFHFTIARFPGRCSICGKTINKGDKIYYNPETKSVHCVNDTCALRCR